MGGLAGFEEVDVDTWPVVAPEPRGKRPKSWVQDPNGQRWLRKEPHPEKPFQLLVEVFTLGIATSIGVPSPGGSLCRWRDGGEAKTGIIVRSFCDLRALSMGAEAISGVEPSYDPMVREAHTLERVRATLLKYGAEHHDPAGLIRAFARILTLDAWLGVQDRHGENWGLIESDRGFELAPFFDGAACLGSELNSRSLEKKSRDLKLYTDLCPSGFGDGTRLLTQKEVIRRVIDGWPESRQAVREVTRSCRDLFDNRLPGYLGEMSDLLPPERASFFHTVLKLRLEWIEEVGG